MKQNCALNIMFNCAKKEKKLNLRSSFLWVVVQRICLSTFRDSVSLSLSLSLSLIFKGRAIKGRMIYIRFIPGIGGIKSAQ